MISSLLKKSITICVQFALIILIATALLEAVVAISLSHPNIGILPLHLVRYIYNRFDRNVIQVMPECAQYDPYVTYTLKPGKCVFQNREFSNTYHINSLGLRDDEQSLVGPKIIALGDSFTMGWGVEQEETFVQQLEKLTGLKIINAGISSYGTVREFRILERLDTSAANYLIVQYTSNDVSENETLSTKGELTVLNEEKYLNTVKFHSNELTYIPGKFSFNILVQLQSELRKIYSKSTNNNQDKVPIEKEVQYFLDVLDSSKIDIAKLKIIILDISPYNRNNSEFEDELQRQISNNKNKKWSKIVIVRLEHVLKNNMYYTLDDHLNAFGHKAIAIELSHHIN
jgi:hypothetical protein